ncbi:hypothetical protein Q0Z83_017980 [Actinoplanes sichuanensis]|nr:hypothetical protein Q0Z83_017980 [Actinoplanes sichuanensis]
MRGLLPLAGHPRILQVAVHVGRALRSGRRLRTRRWNRYESDKKRQNRTHDPPHSGSLRWHGDQTRNMFDQN